MSNREIKFRAWNKTHKEMNGDSYAKLVLYRISIGEDGSEYDIMQFTGLKDKNGVEIYEGDIMQHENPFDYPFVVNWIEDKACFSFNNDCTSYLINDFSFTVIGNIHQNPELL